MIIKDVDSSTQFATAGRIGMYEPPIHQVMWENAYKGDFSSIIVAPAMEQVDVRVENKADDTSYKPIVPLENGQEAIKTPDKVLRRLAQNREAARKSRLRKKAYVQQLEICRFKLAQMEQELTRTRQQGVYATSQLGSPFPINSGILTFEMKYGHWVEEQQRQMCKLKNKLQARIGDNELQMLVENGLNQYCNLFQIKANAAKSDVFYLMSGTWTTPVERYFHWLGGCRPSEILSIIVPQLEPLTEPQQLAVGNLGKTSQQAEDALSQGMDRLQQTLAQSFMAIPNDSVRYGSQTAPAIEQLEALEGFMNQADHLRQQTLQQMSRVLTLRQAARGLIALGEYFTKLRAISSLWATRPRDNA